MDRDESHRSLRSHVRTEDIDPVFHTTDSRDLTSDFLCQLLQKEGRDDAADHNGSFLVHFESQATRSATEMFVRFKVLSNGGGQGRLVDGCVDSIWL